MKEITWLILNRKLRCWWYTNVTIIKFKCWVVHICCQVFPLLCLIWPHYVDEQSGGWCWEQNLGNMETQVGWGVEIKGLRLANTKLAEELREEQAVTMEAHKKNMEDEFEKMKKNMMNELNKLSHNPITSDGERGLMENLVASFQKWFSRVM